MSRQDALMKSDTRPSVWQSQESLIKVVVEILARFLHNEDTFPQVFVAGVPSI